MPAAPVYVSITGLTVSSPWRLPRFWLHAIGSLAQARGAPGMLRVEVRTVSGVRHTLSIWESRAAMLVYLRSGAHLAAVRASSRIGAVKAFGCMTDRPPEWSEVPALWAEHGRGS